ncbi:hypothetical protein HK097_010219 [Rhizophlyctis rosea]|uniref:Alpha-L-arabinofuranosidase n=1 Tax=Rhizophlyctis rosea TaxID=64517 RepID=A0AAD5X408_9FUNG|nr:hypothetical protein HK097_010219 [Rhizophlyctis rosea]
MVAVKDPSIIHWKGKYHVYATGAYSSGPNATDFKMIYTSFKSFEEIAKKPPKITFLDQTPGFAVYGCAPQIFYYSPHKLWYLIFQSPNPTYSTSTDPSNPKSWTAPKIMVDALPELPTAEAGPNSWETWIDFFVICDDTHCHLYYSNDYGDWFRQETTKAKFPLGWSKAYHMWNASRPIDFFEGGAIYKIKGEKSLYLGIHEAATDEWVRYYQSYTANSLRGPWKPYLVTPEHPFAGVNNTVFAKNTKWSKGHGNSGISHGEILRAGVDERMEIDPCDLKLLFQGTVGPNDDYLYLPYRLGLLTSTVKGPGCKKH